MIPLWQAMMLLSIPLAALVFVAWWNTRWPKV